MKAMLQLKIDEQMLLDTAITGIDWACRAFWAEIDRFPSANLFDGYEARVKDCTLPDDEVLFRLRDDEDGMAEAEDRPWMDITLANLGEATARALSEYSHLYNLTVEHDTIIEIDSDGPNADVILQFATLGKVVYG